MTTKTEEKKPRARKTTGTRTSKKGKGDIPDRKRNIPLELLCPMCHKGKLIKTTTDYTFKSKGVVEYTIKNVPCQLCDTCEGKRYDSDDICRPASYAKYNNIKEIDYKVAMKEWEEWQEELRKRRKRLETKPKKA